MPGIMPFFVSSTSVPRLGRPAVHRLGVADADTSASPPRRARPAQRSATAARPRACTQRACSRRRALALALGAVLGAAGVWQRRAAATVVAPPSSGSSPETRYARLRAEAEAARRVGPLMAQMRDGYEALVALRDNWDARTAAMDGDVVRRVIGTVGVTSPLFNIRKTFLRAWQLIAESGAVDEEAIDRMETEWNGILDGLSSIDFQVYSVGFTELQETKQNLLASGKAALDNTIALYKSFLDDIPVQLQDS